MANGKLEVVIAVLVFFSEANGDKYTSGSVYCKNKQCTYKAGVLDKDGATAYGTYNNTLMETGWGILDINSGYGNNATNEDIMYAAGYLEGVVTQGQIYQHYQNMLDFFAQKWVDNPKVQMAVMNFLNDQDHFMRTMIQRNIPDSAYWRHVNYIVSHYDGLLAGYKSAAPDSQQLGVFAFQLLNGNGDLLDLINALNPEGIPDWKTMTQAEAVSFAARHGFCSTLIKVLGAYEDIFMSHSSWFIYQATMRIFKHYNFNIQDPATAAKRLSFSSYPGYLESLDDFYLLGSKMVMLQTTNNIFNTDLYKKVTSNSLLAWHRVRLANMMAHSGQEWATLFAQFNSGTYNNQYMIVDLKKIELRKNILDGALWVVEQIPGDVVAGDTTPILRTGYWPSYNIPYFEEIYNKSGYPDFVARHGIDFSYQLAPRAKIFRRDQGKVVDMATMKKIMRYNDYKQDPYSENNSCNTICCRGDLMSVDPGPFGCYDTKVSNFSMAQNFQADIINGPTTGTGLPPFQWQSKYKGSHVGLPNVYNFDFVTTFPQWNDGH
ncbi:hypothetical protein ACJMK2_033919 [Sinanodonta woodiana]|uniref:Phospholipase B-like n=1 Tax=Sinanodonta woodiana TaxID=1069815 RepID=A0ABD3WPX7_SINWO